MKLIVTLVLALVATSSFAKGSSYPQSGADGGTIVNAAVVPRARIWYDERLWQTSDGQILVCEEEFSVGRSYEKKCYAKGDKDEGNRWTALKTKQADGYILKSYEYRFVGSSGYKIFVAYYGPPEVAVAAPTPTQAASAPTPNITVKIDKVIVERKRK